MFASFLFHEFSQLKAIQTVHLKIKCIFRLPMATLLKCEQVLDSLEMSSSKTVSMMTFIMSSNLFVFHVSIFYRPIICIHSVRLSKACMSFLINHSEIPRLVFLRKHLLQAIIILWISLDPNQNSIEIKTPYLR